MKTKLIDSFLAVSENPRAFPVWLITGFAITGIVEYWPNPALLIAWLLAPLAAIAIQYRRQTNNTHTTQ